MRLFPYAVGILDLLAAVVYVYNRQYLLAITWFCYAIAAVSLGSIR